MIPTIVQTLDGAIGGGLDCTIDGSRKGRILQAVVAVAQIELREEVVGLCFGDAGAYVGCGQHLLAARHGLEGGQQRILGVLVLVLR